MNSAASVRPIYRIEPSRGALPAGTPCNWCLADATVLHVVDNGTIRVVEGICADCGAADSATRYAREAAALTTQGGRS